MAPQDLITTRPLTKADFYAFMAQEPVGRFEFEDGDIVGMTGGTQRHAQLAFEIALIIGLQLDRDAWTVTVADRGVECGEMGDRVRYPDVVVEPAVSADPTSLWTKTPTIIVEVSSPSSEARDREDKADDYAELASLVAYIVADQAKASVCIWTRNEKRQFIPSFIDGLDGVVVITSLGLTLRLADIYRRLPRDSELAE
jgi:Uma2 family endonuclease